MNRSLQSSLVPFGSASTDESPVVVITNSNIKHDLSGGEYPLRVMQCQEAVVALQAAYPEVKSLRDAKIEMLYHLKANTPLSTVSYNRAKHVITEDQRTLGAVEALKRGDFATVGSLMIASHDSLSKDYEVSCRELDILRDLALQVEGVYGSRMTGGGFGGCTVTLVKRSAATALISYLKKEYKAATGIDCECYVSEPEAGCGSIDLGPYLESDISQSSTTTAGQSGSQADRAGSGSVVQDLLNWAVPLAVVAVALGILFHIIRK